MLKLARDVGLVAKLDRELDVIQRPQPYTDSDHVMNIALNVPAAATCSTISRSAAT